MAEKTVELKGNAVLFHKGTHYTNANITDKIATQILKGFPVLESQFVVYPKGYEVETEAAKVADVKVSLGKEKANVSTLKKSIKKEEGEYEKLKVVHNQAVEEHEIALGQLDKADDDQVMDVQKEADTLGAKATDAAVAVEEQFGKVEAEKEKLEEAEVEVDKFTQLLAKRDK